MFLFEFAQLRLEDEMKTCSLHDRSLTLDFKSNIIFVYATCSGKLTDVGVRELPEQV